MFAPVVRMDTVRIFLALAAYKKWTVFQLDVKSAFLNGFLEEDVYIAQPRGFEIPGKETMVYKLIKALYGLKQAPKAWYERLDTWMQSQGFQRSQMEHALYKKVEEDGDILLVCVYVDDLIYMSSSVLKAEKFRAEMKREFEMNDLGVMKYFLGFEIQQDHVGIHVSQKKYTEDLLKLFHMQNCKPTNVPMTIETKQ